MALCRLDDDSPPARSISVPIETRSSRVVPTEDRFSTLPEEIKLNTLGRIPFEEAARARILSRTSNWSTQTQVILDKSLFEERGRWIELHPDAWKNKVTEILTNHRDGVIPIRKFILHIPCMPYKWGLYIDNWLSCLSRNSIEELSVDNCNIIAYELSSILFEFHELTRLMLRNFKFYKPIGVFQNLYKPIGVFQNLQFLRLEKIAFGSDKVGDVTLSTPLLVRVELVDCTGFQYFNIRAPKFKNFVVDYNDGMSKMGRPNFEDIFSCLGWVPAQNYFSIC